MRRHFKKERNMKIQNFLFGKKHYNMITLHSVLSSNVSQSVQTLGIVRFTALLSLFPQLWAVSLYLQNNNYLQAEGWNNTGLPTGFPFLGIPVLCSWCIMSETSCFMYSVVFLFTVRSYVWFLLFHHGH